MTLVILAEARARAAEADRLQNQFRETTADTGQLRDPLSFATVHPNSRPQHLDG